MTQRIKAIPSSLCRTALRLKTFQMSLSTSRFLNNHFNRIRALCNRNDLLTSSYKDNAAIVCHGPGILPSSFQFKASTWRPSTQPYMEGSQPIHRLCLLTLQFKRLCFEHFCLFFPEIAFRIQHRSKQGWKGHIRYWLRCQAYSEINRMLGPV
jgi:hypothetical protein